MEQWFKITDIIEAIYYILGGKATITLSHHDPEKHFIYKVVQYKKDLSIYFVRVKTHNGYKYLGAFRHTVYKPFYTSTFHCTPKSEIREDDLRFKAFKWLAANLFVSCTIPAKVELFRDRLCCVCGGKLTHPKSIKEGIGPICKKRHPFRGVFDNPK